MSVVVLPLDGELVTGDADLLDEAADEVTILGSRERSGRRRTGTGNGSAHPPAGCRNALPKQQPPAGNWGLRGWGVEHSNL